MIRVSQLKLNTGFTSALLEAALQKKLRGFKIKSFKLVRLSLDCRDKNNIHYSVTADVEAADEAGVLRKFSKDKNITKAPCETWNLPESGREVLLKRPVVAGSGPAGLFCAYMLAEYGFKPLLIERGGDVHSRKKAVEAFHKTGILNPESNVQFGEGGAGTFSDGKLNCSVKDKTGRNALVREIFREHGAKDEIMYLAKPHLGTDSLIEIVSSMRKRIEERGGQVLFNTKLSSLVTEAGVLKAVRTSENGGREQVTDTDILVAALGHSARDTFKMLFDSGLEMRAKSFAVGIRAEHLQEDINRAQYGEDYRKKYKNLPPADYKLTAHTASGRNVFSFCMCPGGYVINSSSEEGGLCINGMSYSGRGGENANAAIIVNVEPEDTGADKDVFAGIRFQQELERKAFEACAGKIPSQRLEDFVMGISPDGYGKIRPQHKGETGLADLNGILPEFVCSAVKEALPEFGRKIKGYDDGDVILSAPESRTSSPVRIQRGDDLQSNIRGIYPCGEGAGYAGGIMSAAMDGIKIFEAIYKRYTPDYE